MLTADEENAAVALALADPSAYLLAYADRPGFADREVRIAAAQAVRDEAEAHEINKARVERPAHDEED